jgi:hypothetical protein
MDIDASGHQRDSKDESQPIHDHCIEGTAASIMSPNRPRHDERHAERVAFGTMSDDTSKQLDPRPPITTSGLQVASRHGRFEEGHPPSGGRPKGSRTRIKADLSQMILNGAAAAGFLHRCLE